MTKSRLILLTSLVVVLAAGAWFIWGRKNADANLNSPQDETQIEQTNEGVTTKTGESPEGQANTDGSISVLITNASQDTGAVHVRTLIEGVTSGTCTLKMTRADRTVERTAPIAFAAQAYTCQGFDIPKSDLGAGEWKIIVSATNGSRTGVSEEQTLRVD